MSESCSQQLVCQAQFPSFRVLLLRVSCGPVVVLSAPTDQPTNCRCVRPNPPPVPSS